jgi:hypothetical protein
VCYIDDDDRVSETYISDILSILLNNDVDCCSLVGEITIDGGVPQKFIHSLKYEGWFDEGEGADKVYYRNPNHLNVIKQFLKGKRTFGESHKLLAYIKENFTKEELENEVWKTIPGYEGYYEVSNLGGIRSFQTKVLRKMNGVNSSGYQVVVFYKEGKTKSYTVHRLVAKSFISNHKSKREVNHINGVKTDNRVENLEWVTPRENQRHSVDTGLKSKGESNYNSKLTEIQAREIKYGHLGLSHKEIACIYGVATSRINAIRMGRDWKHI